MSIGAKIRNSETLLRGLTWAIARYLKFCFSTTRWHKEGLDEMHATLSSGQPVIIVCWHQRLIFAPVSWDHSKGKACTLRAISHSGRVSGGVQERLGLISIPMQDGASNLNASRKIARMMKEGISLGITADGPEGPPQELKTAVLEWARLTRAPIFMFSFSVKKFSHWDTWDKMVFPKPFNQGVLLFRKWEGVVPRKPNPTEMEELRKRLEGDLDALTEQSDQKRDALS